MVKVDYRVDYYADLDVSPTADQETIKKRFRDLAKLYHPDKNPGREAEVVSKFQTIQAAHAVLNNPEQKAKYDEERAKLKAREAEASQFRKPPPPKRTESGFTNGGYTSGNAGRRDPSATRYAPQSTSRSRPTSAAPTGADKFAQFARAAPPQWDRTRYEEAARAEGLRGMNFMRGGQMPQTSPLRSRPPTAPKTNGESYSPTTEPSPGFPGLNRTTSRRGWSGHGAPNDDNVPTSAYAHVNRDRDRDRPPSSTHESRFREQDTPLRQNRSFQPEDFGHLRPGLSRTSSRYARAGGERTEINTGNLSRATSVRNSPQGRQWAERETGPFGNQSGAEDRAPRPRHRSHSPTSRKPEPTFAYASESTSSDEDDLPPPGQRKKAPLRRPQTTFGGNGMGSGVDGYFPSSNYTRVVDDNSTYEFPAPEDKGPPTRKPFPNMTSPVDVRQSDGNDMPHRMSSHEEMPTNQPFQSDQQDRNKFSAEEWHEELDNHSDLFNPPDTFSKDRKSPTKNLRSSRSGPGKYGGYREVRRDQTINEEGNIPGFRYVSSNGTRNNSETAFRPAKLSPDFVDKATTRNRSATTPTSPPPRHPDERGYPGIPEIVRERPTPDEMDVDSPAAADTDSGASTNVVVEEEHSNVSTSSTPSPRQTTRRASSHRTSDARRDGFDLDDLKKSAPFASSNSGLKDLDDLTNNLPFESRPAETLEALHRTSSHTLRQLNLPRPPSVPRCPSDDNVTRVTWDQYIKDMNNYMHEWAKFNAAMIEHFAARQQATTHDMWRNWIESADDGPSAEDYEADNGIHRVGFAAYLTWVEDDRKCRTWWDVACEEHRVAIEQLGRIRNRVKELRRAHAR